MPVILHEKDEMEWLRQGKEGAGLLKPYPEREMDAWTVSRKLTSRDPDKNSEKALEKVEYPELADPEASQGTLF
jgi:putative SOS response-associated peptidase YedK